MITAEEFTAAREEARDSPDTSVERNLETEFLEEAALNYDHTYARGEVEIVDLGPALLVGPVDLQVEEISIVEDATAGVMSVDSEIYPGHIDASVPSSGSADEDLDADAADEDLSAEAEKEDDWGGKAGGSYKLILKDYGDAIFYWNKARLLRDGDSKSDYWTYRRSGDAQPVSITAWPDPRVAVLYMRNYPTDDTYDILKEWVAGSEPASDYDGDCDNSTTYLEAGFTDIRGGATVGVSFTDCARIDVARNIDVPGEMRVQMTQGLVTRNPGNIGAGYIALFKTKNGKKPYFNDQQKVTFRKYTLIYEWGPGLFNSKTCDRTNSGSSDC